MRCKSVSPIILPCVCIIWIAINAVFMQFLHYDSQYRHLNPKHYNADVITQEDYKQLSNSKNQSVTLSNGKTVSDRTPAWHSHVLPKYKSVNNGSSYMLVTVRGTAPFIHQWYSSVLPIFIVCLCALFYDLRANKQSNNEPDQPIGGTA